MSTAQPGPPCELCGSRDHTPDAHFDGTVPLPPTRGVGRPPVEDAPPDDGGAPGYATEPIQVEDDDDR